jgi:hypothetical protein
MQIVLGAGTLFIHQTTTSPEAIQSEALRRRMRQTGGH